MENEREALSSIEEMHSSAHVVPCTVADHFSKPHYFAALSVSRSRDAFFVNRRSRETLSSF